jgi:uncharacterized protein (TIGR02611 family)
MAANRRTDPVWARAGRIALGFVVVVFGIIDLPLPGPGTVFIAIGLLILAPEIPAVRRLLAGLFRRWPHVRRRVPKKHRKFSRRGPRAHGDGT